MSLINQLKKEVKEKYPEVHSVNNKTFESLNFQFSRVTFGQVFGTFILLIIIVTFYTLFLNWEILKILNVNFEDNIKIFTTSIITLVSMNLFVTNLLFTHLKEERDEIQYIIDSRIHFKFITYLGFTIILCVLCLYFVSPSFENASIKANILILLFISFLYYISKLILLYTTVFNFLNKSKRTQIVKDELNTEFFKAFYQNFLKSEFKKSYLATITKYGFSSYYSFSLSTQDFETIGFTKKFNCFLHDINLSKLESYLKEIKDNNKKYAPLELNQEFEKNKVHNIFTFEAKQKLLLKKYFIFKKKSYLSYGIEKESLNRLLGKVAINTLNNKFHDLGENLKSLDDIYERYVKLDNHD